MKKISAIAKSIWQGIFITIILFSFSATSPQTSLDTTFGNNGTMITIIGDNSNGGDEINCIKVLPTGKILAGGFAHKLGSQYFAVARYNPNGTLDNSYGYSGITLDDFPDSYGSYINEFAVLPDSSFIAAGVVWKNAPSYYANFGLIKYKANGDLDNSFGNYGFVTDNAIDEFNSNGCYANTIAIQADGKIVVGGYTEYNTRKAFTLIRFNPNGKRDSTFGLHGVVRTYIYGGAEIDDYCNKVLIQNDGKILALGKSYDVTLFGRDAFALVRYNTNGSVDTTFGTNGFVRTYVYGSSGDNSNNTISSGALQTDGKILAGGILEDSVHHFSYALARYNTDGSLDSTFGLNGGTVTTHVLESTVDFAYDILIQPNEKIVLAGYSTGYFSAARFNKSGILDYGFGQNGTFLFGIQGSDHTSDCATSVSLQADGKIVLGGYIRDFTTNHQFALARINPSDPSSVNNEQETVNSFSLSQNYPNPFNPKTTIRYSLPFRTYVSIKIYDIIGNEISELVNSEEESGSHNIIFDASKLASGMYIYKITAGSFSESKKMVVLK